MKDTRRGEHILTSAHVANWIKCHHDEWLERYMSTKKSETTGYNALLHLLERFAYRHVFSQRVACVSRKRQGELDVVKRSFAKDF
ncbi:unnamed protein product, partial [Aphanomyces euteiches]